MRWFLLLLLLSTNAFAGAYYNSSESGCDGSDTNVAYCEDFETAGGAGGRWYGEDCDTANSNGGVGVRTKGWCGTIFANPISPAGAELCGAGVTPFGNCVGDAGTKSGAGGENMAIRGLKTSGCGTTGAQKCGVTTLYVRWYAKWVSGYQFGAEKHMNITDLDGDIAFANVQLNCGAGSSSSTATPYIQIIHGEDTCQSPNVSSITLQSGHWYFFEIRVTAHATNGTVQLWINDCGTDGTSCGASPTLRTEMTGQRLPGNTNSSTINATWLESWANPASSGTGPYWDQVKASQVGPIGFAPQSGTPSAPTGLHIVELLIGLGLALLGILITTPVPSYAKTALASIGRYARALIFWRRPRRAAEQN